MSQTLQTLAASLLIILALAGADHIDRSQTMTPLAERILAHIQKMRKPKTARQIIDDMGLPIAQHQNGRDIVMQLARNGHIASQKLSGSLRTYGPLAPVNLPLISALGYPTTAPDTRHKRRQYGERHSATSSRTSLPRSATSAALAIAAGE